MAKSQPPHGGDDPEIADAADLLRDTPAGWAKSTPKPQARPTPGVEPEAESEGYELAEHEPPAPKPAPLPFDDEPPRTRTRARPGREAAEDFEDDEPRDRDRDGDRGRPTTLYDPDEAVEEVWSRRAEWWPSLLALAAVALVMWLCLFFAPIPTALVLVVGLVALALLSYPIVITLERPVRITPEQAARDYYGALSHMFPHYRRMWLLLSAGGRHSSRFDSFPEFKSYWKNRLMLLNGGKPAWPNSLGFEVGDYKGEKSGGKAVAEAKYTVRVVRLGKADAPPIDSVRVSATFVRGPDNMWYLDEGTL
ncbi:MAG TPA: hypothetical protein VG406_04600 [Isosphaeraceae bacterium]|jgi:hypothetical protein|nr:hypothetical protein [Isosphaeraceae bacterium]